MLTVLTFGYLILNYERIAQNGGRINQFELIIAGVALVLAFEAARRASGNLAILALIFLAYNWFGQYLPGKLGHNGFTLKRVLSTQFWGTQGLLGTGIGVSATYIFLFVVFGAFLKYSGFSRFINDFSLTLVGQTAGRSGQGGGPRLRPDGHDQRLRHCQRGHYRHHYHPPDEADGI